jgi:hypothetical protein
MSRRDDPQGSMSSWRPYLHRQTTRTPMAENNSVREVARRGAATSAKGCDQAIKGGVGREGSMGHKTRASRESHQPLTWMVPRSSITHWSVRIKRFRASALKWILRGCANRSSSQDIRIQAENNDIRLSNPSMKLEETRLFLSPMMLTPCDLLRSQCFQRGRIGAVGGRQRQP